MIFKRFALLNLFFIIGIGVFVPQKVMAYEDENLALLKPVSANSVVAKHPPALAVDGNDNSCWKSDQSDTDPWIEVYLEKKQFIDHVVVPLFSGFKQLSILAWENDHWSEVFNGNVHEQVLFGFNPIETDRIRLIPESDEQVTIYEIQIHAHIPQPVFVNQSGYNLTYPKRFTAPKAENGTNFQITREESSEILFQGKIVNKIGDFSGFMPVDPGPYIIKVVGQPEKGTSLPFSIGAYWLEKVSYNKAIEFMVDCRCWWGDARKYAPTANDPDCPNRGVAWRDGVQYSFEVPSLIMMYLANPDVYTTDRMPVQGPYLGLRHELPENTPEIIRLIYWGVDIFLRAKVDHALLKEQLAYFIYNYPYYSDHIPRQVYEEAVSHLFEVWGKEEYDRFQDSDWNMPEFYTVPHTADLFQTYKIIGTSKGQFPPGHSIIPNLMMYEVAMRENYDNASRFFKAAYDQTQWLIKNLNWYNPKITKGQRQTEWVTITSLVYFLKQYPGEAPAGLKDKIKDWAQVMVSRSNNLWDFRKYSEERWVIPNIRPPDHPSHAQKTGFNEPGNVAGLPAPLLAASMVIDDQKLKQRLKEIAIAHFDNIFGRNPTGRHFSYDGVQDFEGVELGWYKEYQGGAAQLQYVRGVLDGSPKETTYPFDPYAGDPGHTEGWVTFNTAWNVALAYLSIDDTNLELFDGDFIQPKQQVSLKNDFQVIGVRLSAPLNLDYQNRESGNIQIRINNEKNVNLEVLECNPNSPDFRGVFKVENSKLILSEKMMPIKAGDVIKVSYGYGYFQKSASIKIVE